MMRPAPLGSSPNRHLLAVWLWAGYLASLSDLPVTFLVQKAHLLRPKLLVALVLMDAVAPSRVLPAQILLFLGHAKETLGRLGRASSCGGLTRGDFSRAPWQAASLLSLPPRRALGEGTYLGTTEALTSLLSSCSDPRRESRSWVSCCSSSSWA